METIGKERDTRSHPSSFADDRSIMGTWKPAPYLQFAEERTRPCRDLIAQIPLASPPHIIDLGCGPGNSTAALAARWPPASLTGLDSSADMLERARTSGLNAHWRHSDIATFAQHPDRLYDLVFSNAALHWLPRHDLLLPQLLAAVQPGGVFAFQVPDNLNEPAHRLMRELAASPAWRPHFPADGVREWFVHPLADYYDLLRPHAHSLNLWTTTYQHILPNAAAITAWYSTTGLRPFLNALADPQQREDFLAAYTALIEAEFRPQADNHVLFPFRRLFLIATK